jgi:hypothetical protein
MSELFEGGNVFKDDAGSVLTVRINKADVLPTVQWLEKITGLELTDYMLGTTGKKMTSGDLDLAVDANAVDKNEFANRLAEYIKKQGGDPKQWIKKSGVSVHFKTPIKGDEANGHVKLASIAKARGMKWSFQNGLVNRETNEVISRDPNEIAKKLLGQTATPKNLEDPEAIIDFIIKLPNYEELIADARETLSKEGVQLPEAGKVESYTPGSGAWFRKMIEIVK